MKNGVWTTEFWSTILIDVVFIGTMLGWFQQEDQTALNDAVMQGVAGVAAAVRSAMYIWSRTHIKLG